MSFNAIKIEVPYFQKYRASSIWANLEKNLGKPGQFPREMGQLWQRWVSARNPAGPEDGFTFGDHDHSVGIMRFSLQKLCQRTNCRVCDYTFQKHQEHKIKHHI